MLELIDRQVSVSEKHLREYIENRLKDMKPERIAIANHIEELNKKMALLPQRRVAEMMIEQNMETGRLIVEEMAKMVESKNISHKLELVQSAPVDIAVLPLHPTSDLLLFTLSGMLLGGLLSFGTIVAGAISRGPRASRDNLTLMNRHVAGMLSAGDLAKVSPKEQERDLETLKRLLAYLLPADDPAEADAEAGKALLLVEGSGPDYSPQLAALLKGRGFATVTLPLFPESLRDLPALLDTLTKEYRRVIAVSRALPASFAAEELLPLFTRVAVTVTEETLPELAVYTRPPAGERRKTSFLLIEEEG